MRERLAKIQAKIEIKENEIARMQLRRDNFLRAQKNDRKRANEKRVQVRERYHAELEAQKDRLLAKQARLEADLAAKTQRLKEQRDRKAREAQKAWNATKKRISQQRLEQKAALEAGTLEKARAKERRVKALRSAKEQVNKHQIAEANRFSLRRDQLIKAIQKFHSQEIPLKSLSVDALVEVGMPKDLAEQALVLLGNGR
mmetsp:Transcript_17649/g.24689  ORF Transcript_17649/g.24689 Transcript_17649/m.24689 type:complete len:200 (+) Transcript_17649:102-701(+)